MITATEDSVLYLARAKKGEEGVKDTPVDLYNGTLVSDHESAIAKHGSRHQECMSHVRRYTIASIENERKMKWNRMLFELSISFFMSACPVNSNSNARKENDCFIFPLTYRFQYAMIAGYNNKLSEMQQTNNQKTF